MAVRKKIGSTIYAAGCFCIDPVNPAYWSNIDTQNLGLHCSVQAENIGVHILFGPVFYESNLPNGAVVFILHNKAFCPFVPSIFSTHARFLSLGHRAPFIVESNRFYPKRCHCFFSAASVKGLFFLLSLVFTTSANQIQDPTWRPQAST